MSWFQQLGGLLQQYTGAQPAQPPPNVQNDFRQFARAAPPDALAAALGSAFQSDQTPPFGQMVSQLFGQSDPQQRAGLLNTLLGAVGPQLLSGALSRFGGQGGFTPEQASQIPPEAVQQAAEYAQNADPSIMQQVGGFYAQHPDLFHTLGAGALTAALSGLAQNQGGGGVLPASQDPYGDPGAGGGSQDVMPASSDPYGDPADEADGAAVLPSTRDPYGDPADRR